MIDINIHTLIPQKPPFIAVSNLISCDEINTETSFEIQKDSIFAENEELSEAGIIENFAQTCAVRLGYLNKNDTVKIGMIGSIDNIEIFCRPKVNSILFTTISVTAELMNILLVEAQSISDNKNIAICRMKIFLTDINAS
jgi:predicted hotdog family 3-hydroxylacyl-ACP dehydratase